MTLMIPFYTKVIGAARLPESKKKNQETKIARK
jgi:hypothetical protein